MTYETSQLYFQRRRSDSLTLRIYQWSFGSSNSFNSDISPLRTASPELQNRSSRNSDNWDEDSTYATRKEQFRARNISGESIDNLSRTIATQTPTENLHFVFPSSIPLVDAEDNENHQSLASTSEKFSQVDEQTDLPRVFSSTQTRRRHSFIDYSSVPSVNVPRTMAMEIPSGGRRTLSHSLSYSGGFKETSSVGKELRSIGDDFDRIGGRSRSSSLFSSFSSLS